MLSTLQYSYIVVICIIIISIVGYYYMRDEPKKVEENPEETKNEEAPVETQNPVQITTETISEAAKDTLIANGEPENFDEYVNNGKVPTKTFSDDTQYASLNIKPSAYIPKDLNQDFRIRGLPKDQLFIKYGNNALAATSIDPRIGQIVPDF